MGPGQPTERELSEHSASGHAVHRSSPIRCMRARGATQAQPRLNRAVESVVPMLHLDYFYLSSAVQQEEEDVMPHLVARCDKTRRTWVTALLQKGNTCIQYQLAMFCDKRSRMETDGSVFRQRTSSEGAETGGSRGLQRSRNHTARKPDVRSTRKGSMKWDSRKFSSGSEKIDPCDFVRN